MVAVTTLVLPLFWKAPETSDLWLALAGWLVFAHAPDRWTLTGICIIAISGAVGTRLTARERRSRI